MFWEKEGVILWDRYGRTATQTKQEIVYGMYTFSWKNTNQTQIIHADGEVSLT